MFYQAVEECVMQNRQFALAKDLEFIRQLQGSLESKSGKRFHFLAEAGDWLRNRVRFSKADTNASLDCVAC